MSLILIMEYLRTLKEKKYDTKNKETAFSGKGTAIFVLGPDDTLYSESHKVNEFHHSSFLSGSRIKCAGEIVVDDGNVVGMTPKTGHYKSLDEHFQAMLEHLEEKGIDLAKVAVQFPFDKDFKTKHFNAYEVLHEVYKKEDQELKDITAYDERGEACKAQVTKSVQI